MLVVNSFSRTFFDIDHATLTFLGHVVGHGQVKPIEAKVEAISNFCRCPHAKDN